MTSVANQLAALTGLAQRMEEVVPGALRSLDEHLSELDGMAHGGEDAVVSTSLGSSVVERAAMQLATGPYARDRDQIVDGICNIAAAMHHVLRVAGKHVAVVEHERCDGSGRTGFGPNKHDGGWQNPECRQFADRGPLCISCAKREYRWRVKWGYEARKKGAA